MALAPPVSGRLRLTPTTNWAMPWMVRPVGMASMASRLSTDTLADVVTSTTGDEPVTVIVSSREPTESSALMVAVNSACSCNPSRLKVLNPGSVKDTL